DDADQDSAALRRSIGPRIETSSASTPSSSSRPDESSATKYFAALGSRGVPISARAFQGEIMIVNAVSEIVFAHERQRVHRAGAIDEGCGVGVAVEAAALFSDVVGDDQVEIFLAQFFLRVGGQVFGFGGKADEPLAIPALPQLFENVGIGLEADLHRPVPLDLGRG